MKVGYLHTEELETYKIVEFSTLLYKSIHESRKPRNEEGKGGIFDGRGAIS